MAHKKPGPRDLKKDAHQAVARAKRRLELPQKPCEVCGALKVVAHHDDYSRPLDVTWLCYTHHKARHVELGWGISGRQTRTDDPYDKWIEAIMERRRKDS